MQAGTPPTPRRHLHPPASAIARPLRLPGGPLTHFGMQACQPGDRPLKRQQQTSTDWVRGLSDKSIGHAQRIVGLDPGRKSCLFPRNAVAVCCLLLPGCEWQRWTKYSTLSWSSGSWRETSGINYRLNKTQVWLSQNCTLKTALEGTLSKGSNSTQHINYRMQHEVAAVDHFGDRRHIQLLWRTFIKTQQAYFAICRFISAGS
ncbi:hypothetical protein ABBQ38_012854 [Trebouxia sp. C0009 RCD-2024]